MVQTPVKVVCAQLVYLIVVEKTADQMDAEMYVRLTTAGVDNSAIAVIVRMLLILLETATGCKLDQHISNLNFALTTADRVQVHVCLEMITHMYQTELVNAVYLVTRLNASAKSVQ
ncbi:hypothetical protein ACFLRW_07900 [Acidobacteriota bacterium]